MIERKDLKQKIIEMLDEHNEGLSILEISELVGSHRHTVTKYIHELIGAGIIFQRDMGIVKLHYLASKFPEKERQLLEKLTKRVKK
jgi:DNA-binding IclR family transcriptional regulator